MTIDALVAVCAQKAGADYIVTRDDKFLRDDSPVKAITPKELLQARGEGNKKSGCLLNT